MHTVKDRPLIITFSEFQTVNCTNSSLTYTLLVNGNSTLPSWLTFDISNRLIRAEATSNSQQENYSLTLVGSIIMPNSNKVFASNTSFSLLVLPLNSAAPSFKSALQD